MFPWKVLCDVKAEYGVEVTFPVAPFSVVLGFGLILIIEQAVLHFQVRKWNLWLFSTYISENASKTGATGGEGAGRAAAFDPQHTRVNTIIYPTIFKRTYLLILNTTGEVQASEI